MPSGLLSSKFNSYVALDFRSHMTEQPVAFDEANDFKPVVDSDSDEPAEPQLPRQVSDGSRNSSKQSHDDGCIAEIEREDLNYLEKVGAGVTAEVFRGSWKGKVVAIKVLSFSKKKASATKQKMAFCRETDVAAKIRHKNLVEFYGMCFARQPYLVVTEFMSGGTVFEFLHCDEAVMLQWKQRLQMCSDVASAMDYLHTFSPQIIHRDLKSLNLLLSKSLSHPRDVPEVKVSDFGLAKMKDDEEDWGKMTMAAGTFHWMAPEVHTGLYDEKVDVYSYAMVLYEIICYEVPFQDLAPSEVIGAVRSGNRPHLDAVPHDCPKKLVDLMVVCWSEEASLRPSFKHILTVLNSTSLLLPG